MKFAAIALAAAVLSASALAQDATGRQFEAARTADMANFMWKQQQGAEWSEGTKAANAIAESIGAKDCPQAAQRLNAGLAAQHREVQLLAGSLFQDGICVKASAQRAASFFERAHTGGHPAAAHRLVGLYASANATPTGPDFGSALWWASKAGTALPASCSANPADEAAFVATLNGWGAQKLRGCVYSAAVMAAMQAELSAPELAAALGVEGPVRLSFSPASGALQLSDDLVPARGSVGSSDASSNARRALNQQLRQTQERVSKALSKPEGVAPEWRAEAVVALKR